MSMPLGDIPLPAELATTGDEPDDELLDRWFEHQASAHGTTLDDDERYVPDAVARFVIDDDGKAEWALRKLAQIRATKAEHAERRDEWVARITAWFDKATAKLDEGEAWFTGLLTEYVTATREASGGKTKTITLPSGTLGTKIVNPAVQIDDKETVLAWAQENAPEFVKTVHSIGVRDLREVASVVEVPDVVLLSCGHEVFAWMLDRTGLADGVTCPECEQDALVGKWVKVSYKAVKADTGEVVPGASVSEASLTVQIEAS